MTAVTQPHHAPRFATVLIQQVRAVGLALRWEFVALAVLLGFLTIMALREVYGTPRAVLDFEPDVSLLLAPLGLLFPILVWKGEKRFGGGYIWTLPVDTRLHALAKIFAGAFWLLVAIALVLVWMSALALASGGAVLPTDQVVIATSTPNGFVAGPAVEWKREAWLLFVPIVAGLVGYLLGSAALLGLKHPVRWVVGVMFVAFATGMFGTNGALEGFLGQLLGGPLGLDYIATGGIEGLEVRAPGAHGQPITAWRALPDVRDWLVAVWFWLGLGLALLLAAVSRYRGN